jgi:hypothetical protein
MRDVIVPEHPVNENVVEPKNNPPYKDQVLQQRVGVGVLVVVLVGKGVT